MLFANHPPQLFLCNSTVSCLKDFENQKIELFIGLFSDPEGSPITIRHIEKNTPDVVTEHVGLLMKMFGVGRVIHYGKWKMPIDIPFDEGINELSSISTVKINIAGTTYWKVPTPTGLCKELLDAANVKLPLMIPVKVSLSNTEHNE
jgi:hypothetical protein